VSKTMTMRLEARLEVPLGGTDAERRLSGRQLAGRGMTVPFRAVGRVRPLVDMGGNRDVAN